MKVTYSWKAPKLPAPNRKVLKRAIERAAQLAKLPVEQNWECNILFVTDKMMAKSNMELLGHEGTTDVITFCYLEEAESTFDGDVGIDLIISAEIAVTEGEKRADSSYANELMLYIVHGLLHSSGEDDLTPAARRRMRRREREVMTVLQEEYDLENIFLPSGLN